MLRPLGEGGNREMNWPPFLTSIPEALTLAPSPSSFRGFDQNKTSNLIISVLKNTLNKIKNKGRFWGRRGCVIPSSFKSTRLNPSSEDAPTSIPGKEQSPHDKSKLQIS